MKYIVLLLSFILSKCNSSSNIEKPTTSNIDNDKIDKKDNGSTKNNQEIMKKYKDLNNYYLNNINIINNNNDNNDNINNIIKEKLSIITGLLDSYDIKDLKIKDGNGDSFYDVLLSEDYKEFNYPIIMKLIEKEKLDFNFELNKKLFTKLYDPENNDRKDKVIERLIIFSSLIESRITLDLYIKCDENLYSDKVKKKKLELQNLLASSIKGNQEKYDLSEILGFLIDNENFGPLLEAFLEKENILLDYPITQIKYNYNYTYTLMKNSYYKTTLLEVLVEKIIFNSRYKQKNLLLIDILTKLLEKDNKECETPNKKLELNKYLSELLIKYIIDINLLKAFLKNINLDLNYKIDNNSEKTLLESICNIIFISEDKKYKEELEKVLINLIKAKSIEVDNLNKSLFSAINIGSFELVKAIVEKGADLTYQKIFSGEMITPLRYSKFSAKKSENYLLIYNYLLKKTEEAKQNEAKEK